MPHPPAPFLPLFIRCTQSVMVGRHCLESLCPTHAQPMASSSLFASQQALLVPCWIRDPWVP